MPIPVYKVDAFTDRPFAGNPAAVCFLEAGNGWPDDDWMRLVAREMAASETAFLIAPKPANRAGAPSRFPLRWFTPELEVDLCGHGTLATAHLLWETGRLARTAVARFETRSGVLSASCGATQERATQGPDAHGTEERAPHPRGEDPAHHGSADRHPATRMVDWITLDFPALGIEPGDVPPEVIDALGARPVVTGRCGPRCFLELATEDEVRRLTPDFAKLRSVPGRAVIVTSRAKVESGFDFVSRYFAPWVGVNEDPVTGSAHCGLATYWAARLGKPNLRAFQASPRGGEVRVTLDGQRVRLSGKAVTVVAGRLLQTAGSF